jgi:hypothetical protein
MRVKNGTATQEEVDLYEKSLLDADKDKIQFHQYEDACDRASRTSTASSTRSRPWRTTPKLGTISSSRHVLR